MNPHKKRSATEGKNSIEMSAVAKKNGSFS